MTDDLIRRRRAITLGLRYVLGLTLAHVLATAEVAAIVLGLSGDIVAAGANLFRVSNKVVGFLVCTLGVVAIALAGVWVIMPSLRWYSGTDAPSAAEARGTLLIPDRQSVLILATWTMGAAAFGLFVFGSDPRASLLVGVAAIFGGVTTMGTSYLVTQHILRPLLAEAMRYDVVSATSRAPGVLSRLIIIWVLCSALPTAGIGTLVCIRNRGWLIDERALLSAPVLVIATVALLVGLRATILVSRTISDPIGEVVLAMSALEEGHVNTEVPVYEYSEIGQLQRGFNKMATGLAERERLRDLFGRHVGGDVAKRALESGATDGDVLEVAVLFVDLSNFTRFAATHPPREVANALNEFLQIVVTVVDENQGLINKFAGDAALAVFGAPRHLDDAAGAALASGRKLATALLSLAEMDFGIGVTAGQVFAGNVGGQARYEYTVVGDPVNEAARLADAAKERGHRLLCTQDAIARCGQTERQRWSAQGHLLLRGRPLSTKIYEPHVLE